MDILEITVKTSMTITRLNSTFEAHHLFWTTMIDLEFKQVTKQVQNLVLYLTR